MRSISKKLMSILLACAMLLVQTFVPSVQAAEDPVIRGTFQYAGMYNNVEDSTLDYAYSDAYFAADARVYNPSLSSMSLCLEMSSWSSLDEEDWVDKSANARELLTDLGFIDFAQNDFWNAHPTVESIGAVAARKELQDATLIALAVRGGGYFSEWGSNVLIGDADAHTGFATARDNVLAFLQEYVAANGITGRVKLWLVGFSRGAAVANMTAGYLNDNGLSAEATLVPQDLYCYTFEAPQGIQVSAAGADADYSNIHNIINPNDIVPLVAPDGWGFARYNQTSHLLPTITTVHYADAREKMLEQYARILEPVNVLDENEAAYNIAEYAKTLEMKVNWQSILPGGAPFIELNVVDNTHLPQAVMLNEFVSALIHAAKSRDQFHDNIESDISTLLGELMGASKGASLSDYIQQLGDALTANDGENLAYIIEPIIQLNFTSLENRLAQVTQRLREVIPQPEGYTDIVGTVTSLVDVMATMLVEDPEAILNLVLSLSNTSMIQAHYAEVTLAWLRAADPNFTDDPITCAVPEAMRIVRVNCPVDVLVYNSRSDLVASIINGVCTIYKDGVGCAVNPDGEKVFYLPADDTFVVRIQATGDGTMDCSMSEFNIVRGQHSYAVNFTNVPIADGDTLHAVVPILPKEEYTDEPVQGSSADYRLLNQRYDRLEPSAVLRGDQVVSYTVSASRNNEFGQVMGGGSYVTGSFAQVEAYPVQGSAFQGWYKDGQLVSSSAVYRFAVTEDVSLMAQFSEAKKHQVTFTAGEGGSIYGADGAYTAGTTLLVSATPAEGYLVKGWSSSAGTVQGSGNTASFVVPDCDATVMVSFVQAGDACPYCKEILPVGVSHAAPCGRSGHYTCKPGYYAYEHRPCPICGEDYDCIPGHGTNAGECGTYACSNCGECLLLSESHEAACGSHYSCEAGYSADEHERCGHCGRMICQGGWHTICTICYRGYECTGGHGTNPGQCGYVPPTPKPTPKPTPTPTPVPEPSPSEDPTPMESAIYCGECSQIVADEAKHLAECGHYTCATDYPVANHTLCVTCSNYKCMGGNHEICEHCLHPLCYNAIPHGTEYGQCGNLNTSALVTCMKCKNSHPAGESHLAECNQHYTCDGNNGSIDHFLCDLCGKGYVCAGEHGEGVCVADVGEPTT